MLRESEVVLHKQIHLVLWYTKAKGRSVVLTIPDDEIEMDQLIFQKVVELSMPNKEKVIQYVDELLQASG